MTDNNGDWKYQVSPKLPDGTLVNIRGNDPFDFKASLGVVADLAPDIAAVRAALNGTATLADAGLTGTAPAPQQQAQAIQQYQQSAAQAAPQAAPAPSGGPVCKHGPMTYRSGTKNGKAWSAHFCPAPKGASDQCDPLWGRD